MPPIKQPVSVLIHGEARQEFASCGAAFAHLGRVRNGRAAWVCTLSGHLVASFEDADTLTREEFAPRPRVNLWGVASVSLLGVLVAVEMLRSVPTALLGLMLGGLP